MKQAHRILCIICKNSIETLTDISLNDKQKKLDERAGFPFFHKQMLNELESDGPETNSGNITELPEYLLSAANQMIPL